MRHWVLPGVRTLTALKLHVGLVLHLIMAALGGLGSGRVLGGRNTCWHHAAIIPLWRRRVSTGVLGAIREQSFTCLRG